MNSFDDIRFNEQGLVPVIIQDAVTSEPLTLAYMNREALEKTLEVGKIHLFRRSKGRLMMKGEQSGMTQDVQEVRLDCAGNSLLIKVKPHGPGCHEGYHSCYYRRLDADRDEWEATGERGAQRLWLAQEVPDGLPELRVGDVDRAGLEQLAALVRDADDGRVEAEEVDHRLRHSLPGRLQR